MKGRMTPRSVHIHTEPEGELFHSLVPAAQVPARRKASVLPREGAGSEYLSHYLLPFGVHQQEVSSRDLN